MPGADTAGGAHLSVIPIYFDSFSPYPTWGSGGTMSLVGTGRAGEGRESARTHLRQGQPGPEATTHLSCAPAEEREL